MMMTKLTTRWQTICTTGYQAGIARDENRAAHGAVCHCQARKNAAGEILGRKVNSNGRHQETGKAFLIDDATLAHWETIERSAH